MLALVKPTDMLATRTTLPWSFIEYNLSWSATFLTLGAETSATAIGCSDTSGATAAEDELRIVGVETRLAESVLERRLIPIEETAGAGERGG